MTREMFHERAVLLALAEKVHQDHIDRLDGPISEKLVPRPYKRRPRPNTAIIALAAQRAIAKREARERAERQMRQWLSHPVASELVEETDGAL